MARWYHPGSEYSEISKEEFELREKIISAMKEFVTEMESYSYFGSNPGIPEDDLDEVADKIMAEFNISSPPKIQHWQDAIMAKHPESHEEFWPDALKLKYMTEEVESLREAIENKFGPMPPLE